MRASKYSEEQIIGFLKQAEGGVRVERVCCKGGFSDATFYMSRAKYGGMDVPDGKGRRELEGENAKLKAAASRGAPGHTRSEEFSR